MIISDYICKKNHLIIIICKDVGNFEKGFKTKSFEFSQTQNISINRFFQGQAVSSYPPTPGYPTASGYPAATSAYQQPASNPGMVPSMSVDGTGLATNVNMAAFEAHLMKLEH